MFKPSAKLRSHDRKIGAGTSPPGSTPSNRNFRRAAIAASGASRTMECEDWRPFSLVSSAGK
jgi:hypothetical protein